MQPYLFPYLGYFQLVHAVDKFVIYDDVNFIKQGWINRNNILLNDRAHLFTIPLKKISSYTLIAETEIADKQEWRQKLLKTITQAYCGAPNFETVFELVQDILNTRTTSVSTLIFTSLQRIAAYLKIRTLIEETSGIYSNSLLRGQDRIIDICKRENAKTYINADGGLKLYSREIFRENEIVLYFLRSRNIVYEQFRKPFIPSLSIIDTLMFNDPEDIKEMLNEYDLV